MNAEKNGKLTVIGIGENFLLAFLFMNGVVPDIGKLILILHL